MSELSKFIVVIRPEFMSFCKDACRAAALNHLLFRIAYKCKDQPKEKIQAGEILWYAKNEQITSEMSSAWGVCKVGKEVNGLVDLGLIGRTNDPTWGANRTKHFFFGREQCAKFVSLCEENDICIVHLDLPPEVKHLIYSSNANDKSIKCPCEKTEANDRSIECNSSIHQMETMDISNANDRSIEAITKEDYKDRHKEDNEDSTIRGENAPASRTRSTASSSSQEKAPSSSDCLPGDTTPVPPTGQHTDSYSHDHPPTLTTRNSRVNVQQRASPPVASSKHGPGQGKEQPRRDRAESARSTQTESPSSRSRSSKQTSPPVVLTAEGQAFLDLYCSMPWIKIAPKVTEKLKVDCERLAPHLQTAEQLYNLKNWMRKQAFFKDKGFSMPVLILALNDWQMTQIDEVPAKPPEPAADELSEKNRRYLEAHPELFEVMTPAEAAHVRQAMARSVASC